MDTHSHHADLNALSKLYCLVQDNDPGRQSSVTKILDEGSSIFVRKLLDDAVERICEAHAKKVVEEKTSKVERPFVVNDAIERLESLIPKLERLSKPYSGSLASSLDALASSSSSYEKATSMTTRRCSSKSDSKFSEYSDFDSSGRSQYGTSQSRTTFDSSFDSASHNGDDEWSPYEYNQSKQRFVGHRKMGKLSRLKDKLGSIFHHHQHHHHHHHHHGRQPRDKNTAEASGSLWKKYGKMFKSNEYRVEDKVEKKYMGMRNKKVEAKNQKRSTISRKGKHEQRNTQQGGHFQELVGGLMRNLRNSNKAKQGGRGKSCFKANRKPRGKLQKGIKRPRPRQKD